MVSGSSVPVSKVAIDAGSLAAKIAVARGDSGPEVSASPVAGGDLEGFRAALAALRFAGADVPVRVAVPDIWLDGGADGGRRQEEFRRVAEDEFGLTAVSWAGQMASATALAVSQAESRDQGRYVVCDVGGTGVRAALCESDGRTVRQVAVHDVPGGGWRDFDAEVRTVLGVASGLAGWGESAQAQEKRARRIFDQIKNVPDFKGARVYSLAGDDGTSYELTAGQAERCFAPTRERIRAAMAAVLAGARPTAAVLFGGLSWFPLAADTLTEATGLDPIVLGSDAAARGALVYAAAPNRLPAVSLPVHQIRNGLLEEDRVQLPWEAQFAPADDEPLTLDGPGLILDIGGRRVEVDVPGLVPGVYRIGVRTSWSGSALLVLRAEQSGPDHVHVVPLDLQEMAL